MLAKKTTIKIGVLAGRGDKQAAAMWQPTAEYLTAEIPEYSFLIVPLNYKQIHCAAKRGEVDFLVTNSGMYVELEARGSVNRIATLKHLRMGKAYTVFGGVIFCRSQRHDITHLGDLKGKTFIAVAENSLGGWRMAWREIKQAGINPYRDFQQLSFGGTQDAVVYAVKNGLVDAGTVSTDGFESITSEGKIAASDFKVINQQTQYTGEFPFALSTRLYPEWPFAVVKHAPPELAEKVAVALLKMPQHSAAAKAANSEGWTIPLNYEPVHECFKELQVEPYKNYGKISSSFELAIKGSNDGFWDWNIETNEVFFSPQWKRMLGFEELEISNHLDEWIARIHPDDGDRAFFAIENYFKDTVSHYELEYRLLHKDGTYRWIFARGVLLRDVNGKPYRMAGSHTDISDRKRVEDELWKYKERLEELVDERTAELTKTNERLQQEIAARLAAEEKLRHDAFHDPLTGLANRALFMDRLSHVVELTKHRRNHLFAVLFVDLDRFKLVNDSLGHLMGDRLLKAIAHRLKSCLRPVDTVARLGGDEFAILLENIKDVNVATSVAQRLQQELALPFKLGEHQVFTSASIGITFSTQPSAVSHQHHRDRYDYDRPEDLLRDADAAMYCAKANGKARHEVFSLALYEQVRELWQIENDLWQAIERQEFQLYYQPIVSLDNGRISGFEALLHWQHPRRGLMYPSEFIEIAEETGAIVPMGWWAIREGCRQLRDLQAHFPSYPSLTLSVNISGRQFRQSDLSDRIYQILLEVGLDARSLKLEIAESCLIDNAEAAADRVRELKALGLQLYLDDFGKGYSSLSRLHEFQIDALKIDRDFVSRIFIDDKSSAIVRTIASLATNLGIEAIAEGVETADHLNFLKSLHCQFGQGYLFSKPVDSEAVKALLLGTSATASKKSRGSGVRLRKVTAQ